MHPQDVQVFPVLTRKNKTKKKKKKKLTSEAADQISAMWSRPGKTWSRFLFINKAIYQAQGSRFRLRNLFPQRLCSWYLRQTQEEEGDFIWRPYADVAVAATDGGLFISPSKDTDRLVVGL